jgi:hypothetical protein
MSFFRTLKADLRERQMFPAVVVLAILVVAIPVAASIVLGKVTTPVSVPIVFPHIQQPAGVTTPQRELADLNTTPVPTAVVRHGAEPDPFRQAGAGSTSAATGGSTPTGTKSTTPATKTTTTPSGTTPVTQAPKTTSPKTTSPKTVSPKTTTKPGSGGSGTSAQGTPASAPASLRSDQAYTANITTKDATGTHALSNVVRLAPLPAAQSPEVIYLGVMDGGKKAAFLFTNAIQVSSKAGSSSDHLTCLPNAADCQIVELSPGQGLSLYPTSNTALIATFSFELAAIGANTYSSVAAATQARDAVSTAGQTLLPLSHSSALSTVSFESKIGALVHHAAPSGSPTGPSGATGPTGSTGATGSNGANGTATNARRLSYAVSFAVSHSH